jgi:probable rRNA maturation factor
MNGTNRKIRFFYNGLNFSFPHRTKFKIFLEKLLNQEGQKPQSINYIFCTDQELRKLNKQYLNHDYYTDILTFDLSYLKKELIAEIFISIPRIKENSRSLGHSFNKELQRVMIHGLLHLCGYMDKTEKEIKKMRQLEDKYLSAYSQLFHVKRRR